MTEHSVIAEHGRRVAAYVDSLAAIGAIQEHAQHGFVAACLAALARLRIADHIDGATPLEEIAARTSCDLLALQRILRFLEQYGVYENDGDRLQLTAKGRMLRSDSPIWSGLTLRGANDVAWHLEHSLRTGQGAFAQAFGCDFWSFLTQHEDQQEAFAESMRLQDAILSAACLPLIDFEGIGTVVDVGGGTGDLLAAILESNPSLRGILVDREAMLTRAHAALRTGPLAQRCELHAGDLFGTLPAADAYILSQVLHDWDDEKAADILGNIRLAARVGARLIVLTGILPEEAGPHPTKTSDIGMMALFGAGRERTAPQLQQLLRSAGWKIASVKPSKVANVIIATAGEWPRAGSDALEVRPKEGGPIDD
jgi:hypothetical protein